MAQAHFADFNHSALDKLLNSCAETWAMSLPCAQHINYWPDTGRCVLQDLQHVVQLRPHIGAWAREIDHGRWPDASSNLVCGTSTLTLLEAALGVLTLRHRGRPLAVDPLRVNIYPKRRARSFPAVQRLQIA